MKFVHYSDKKFRLNKKKKYEQSLDHKPFGFWLSSENVDTSWELWCKREGFNLKGLRVKKYYKVDMIKLLQIHNEDEMYKFVNEYGTSLYGTSLKSCVIDWKKVSSKYCGIYIPYNYKLRFEYSFYYGWDVDSVCIWDLSVLNKKGR